MRLWGREKIAFSGRPFSPSLHLLQEAFPNSPVPSERAPASLSRHTMARIWHQLATALNMALSADGVFLAAVLMAGVN